jgi:hypothetical protein
MNNAINQYKSIREEIKRRKRGDISKKSKDKSCVSQHKVRKIKVIIKYIDEKDAINIRFLIKI